MSIIPRLITGRPLAVETHSLFKSYGKTHALNGITLTVPEGAFYVIVGPNGCGKTTTFRVLLGLTEPDAGWATVFGQTTADPAALRANIGYVPERHDDLYAWMRVLQQLEHHAAYFPAWDSDYARELMKMLKLPLDRKIERLSKGEARRVQLIMALAHRPALLLLDEPLDGLDPIARDTLLSLLADHLADNETTVIVSTHVLHEMERMADHLGVLRDGKVIAQVTRAELDERVRRYAFEAPSSWKNGAGLGSALIGRNGSEREMHWTVWGDEQQISERLIANGAVMRDISRLSLHDAALALLKMQDSLEMTR